MHYLYYVAVPKGENTTNSAKAIARDTLENNNFSSDNNGFWGSSKSDWFVMGGRWGGHLVKLTTGAYPPKENEMDRYEMNGKPHDSMILDQKLFDGLKAEVDNIEIEATMGGARDNHIEIALLSEGGSYVEDEMPLSQFLKMSDIIGNYYIVIVDYHS